MASAGSQDHSEAEAKPPAGLDLLAIVRDERERSIGFQLDPLLTSERERALNYSKGVMHDVPHLQNRSGAVSTDVADTIETIMPDLVEIFIGGDDVASFLPVDQADVQQAQNETDYLHHVFFDDNAGFLILYTYMKDALLTKTGVVKWWWEDAPEVEGEHFEDKSFIEVALAAKDGPIENISFAGAPYEPGQPLPEGGDQAPLWSFDLKQEGPDGRIRIKAIPPEDFTVARDTVALSEATYCAFRSRPRAQTLKADGHDPEIIDRLPVHSITDNEQIKRARDTAGENTYAIGGDGQNRDLRTVEVVEHFVRVLNDDSEEIELWRVFTGADETILIDQELMDRLPISAITPFIVTHRFFGESIADKLIEIQRIKTALLRGQLDSIYFALNQRHVIDMTMADSFTVSDLLDNRPGVPVRAKGATAITPLMSAPATIPYMDALEYMSTVGEQRTGVVRNAQGLNPDTLHDTATGAIALMGAAQRRVRMIARIFAETGIKDMFLGIHATIRKHATQSAQAYLKGKWTDIDPTEWAERNDMKIEIGVGAGGAQQKLGALTQVITLQGEMAKGPGASLVSPQNAYAAMIDAGRAAGLKSPEEYFTDPQGAPPPQPQPNPEMLKLQAAQQGDAAKNKVEQAKVLLDGKRLEFDQANAEQARQAEAQAEQLKDQRERLALQAEQERELAKISSSERIKLAELELRRQELADKASFEREKLRQESLLKAAQIKVQSGTAIDVAEINAGVKREDIHADLAIQASESADAHALASGDHAHEAGMAVVHHQLGEASKKTDPQPEPKGPE